MNKLFEMHLADKPFDAIYKGIKTVEVRLYDEKRKEIELNDAIIFYHQQSPLNYLIAKVIALHRYSSFEQLFASELFSKTGSENLSPQEAVDYMYNFYSKEQEEKYGVLAIEFCIDQTLSDIFDTLKTIYEDCNISKKDLFVLANHLNNYYFLDNGRLNDILNDVYYFEEGMRAKGIKINIGRQCSIFAQLVHYLELNEENAMRLYESFLSYYDIEVFYTLMEYCEEWLTEEQKNKIMAIAKKNFIEEIWSEFENI